MRLTGNLLKCDPWLAINEWGALTRQSLLGVECGTPTPPIVQHLL